MENAGFFSLQFGPAAAQVDEYRDRMIDLTPAIKDFADTAALIARMDLIISVDTAVAHLAGALAKPVWTLLPFASDWRWFLDRDDSPWYPTMRLFRQLRGGDWESVIEHVCGELASLARNNRAQDAPANP
jgi:ADP-heptose:LPS heptosyltransferase